MNRATVGCLLVLLLGVSPVWAAVITVGDHGLLPNLPGQVIQISVSGEQDEFVNTLVFYLQVADGGPEGVPYGGPGLIDGPRIQDVDILSGTIFKDDNVGDYGGGPLIPQFWDSQTFSFGSVVANGLLATVTIDTTGFSASDSWALKMKGTLSGDSALSGPSVVEIENGFITIEGGIFPSNASFDGVSDLDSLTIDFGTLDQGAPAPTVSFGIWNFAVPGSADLNLDSIVGTGDTSTLTTDLALFTGLAPGSSNSYAASMDTGICGDFDATYALSFSDVTGLSQLPLELHLTGSVVPEPCSLAVWLSLGALGITVAARRRRRGR